MFTFRALQAFVGSFFGRGNGSVLLDELHCTGRENNVDNCGSRGWYSSDCNHDEDAGIACLGKNTFFFPSSCTFTFQVFPVL